MKILILFSFLFFSLFTFSQNCLFVLDVKNYKSQSKVFSIKKRKNIQIILKTKECLCTENVFEYFVNSNYYTNGRIINSDYSSDNKYFLLKNKKMEIEVTINEGVLTIKETKNNKTKKYISNNFVLKNLD
jgi:hypothetical protein